MRRCPMLLLVGLVALGGCASANRAPDPPPVPVFFAPGDVPCEYEILGTVRGESREILRTSSQYRNEVIRLLGPEGARRGADAVLAEGFEDRGRRMLVVVDARDGFPNMPARTLEGRALRYVSESCG
jgi:hypothetical protein